MSHMAQVFYRMDDDGVLVINEDYYSCQPSNRVEALKETPSRGKSSMASSFLHSSHDCRGSAVCMLPLTPVVNT